MITNFSILREQRRKYILENPDQFSPEEIEWATNEPPLVDAPPPEETEA